MRAARRAIAKTLAQQVEWVLAAPNDIIRIWRCLSLDWPVLAAVLRDLARPDPLGLDGVVMPPEEVEMRTRRLRGDAPE